jgi:hypothetical protein
MDQEDFRWAYAIIRDDDVHHTVLQYFDRLHLAKEELKRLKEHYPDIPFGIYIPGDQLYIPESAHEQVH